MSNIEFTLTEASLQFEISEPSLEFVVWEQNLTFDQPDVTLEFNLNDETIEFNLGEGVTIVSNVFPYAIQIDEINDNLVYKGDALPGSTTAMPVWRLSKITLVPGGDVVIVEWADGFSTFDKVWDNRLTYTYS